MVLFPLPEIPTLFVLLSLACLTASAESAECPDAFADLGPAAGKEMSKARAAWKTYTAGAMVKLDRESHRIFHKVMGDPEAVLTEAEQSHIRAAGKETLLQQFRDAADFVQKANFFISMQARSKPLTSDLFSKKNIVRSLADGANELFLPGVPVGPWEKARKLYSSSLRKIVAGENPVLTAEQAAFLKKWNLAEDYERYVEEARRSPEKFLKFTQLHEKEDIYRWTMVGGTAAASLLVSATEFNQASPEEDKARQAQEHDSVSFVFSRSPLLPAAILVDGKAVIFHAPDMDSPSGKGEKKKPNPLVRTEVLDQEKWEELQKKIVSEKIPYNRVVLHANKAEREALLRKCDEWMEAPLDPADPKTLFGRKHMGMAPLAEAYKAMQSTLDLPPALLAKNITPFMKTYLGVMKLAGGERVQSLYRVKGKDWEDNDHETRESLEQSVLLAPMFRFDPRFLLGQGVYLYLDSQNSKKTPPAKDTP